MPLPVFVAATGHVYINNTPKAVSVPPGTQSGDILIAAITAEAGATNSINYPVGWTQLQRNSPDAFRESLILAVCTSDGSASYQFSTVGTTSVITLASYRGVSAIGSSGIAFYPFSVADVDCATSPISITGSDVIEVMAATPLDASNVTITAPAGSTVRASKNTYPTMCIADIAVSGSTTTAKSFTLSVSGRNRSVASVLLAGAASGGGTPVSFSGTVNTQSATVGTAFNLNLSSFFTGNLTPFSYSLVAGSLTGTGLTLNTSTGVISGTPTSATTISGLQVRATDTGSNTAQTNAFSITVSAAPQVPQGTFAVGAITVGQTTASVPYTYSASDQTSIQYRINGGIERSAGPSPAQIIGLTATTTYTIEFRAVNATGNGSWSAPANFTTTAAPVTTSITLTGLVNNAGQPLVSIGGITVDVYNAFTGAVVLRRTGLTSTAGADLVVSDASLVAGNTYNVLISIGTAIGAAKIVAVA